MAFQLYHGSQLYWKRFISDLLQIGGFLRALWFPPGTLISSTNKADCHDITETP
jgi:hypothetical protein